MSSLTHEDEVAETVPSILSGHEQQTFPLRGPTPDPDRLAIQHYKNVIPGTRRDSTLTVTYKSPDWNFRLNRKMEGKWIEVPFSDLVKLVPGRNPSATQIKKLVESFGERDFKKISESDMYPILCTAFNAVSGAAKSDSWFKDVADQRESDYVDIRPDLVLYPKQSKFQRLYTLEKGEDNEIPEERRAHLAKCNWALIQAFVECKNKEGEAAFHFADKKKFLRSSAEGAKSQAQIAKYAAEIQLRQHRTHVWSFYFAGPHLRIQRWDRSGCMVSTAINFQQDTVDLVNFVYRLSRASPDTLGYDTTAKLATPKEIKLITNFITDNVWLQRYKQYMLEFPEIFPVYKVAIPTYTDDPPAEDGDIIPSKRQTRSKSRVAQSCARPTKLKNYLVSRPVDCHSSPVGRATKGFVGFDMENRRMVFIKDQWRPIAPGAHPELETYERLRKKAVVAVATCLGGSDVFTKPGSVQRTLGHEHLPVDIGIDNCERHHTRLILQQIGRPLFEYPNSPELITIVYHALLAHSEAWEEAKVLHRDLSVGNIMIDVSSPERGLVGFLTDWDMCKYAEDLTGHVPALPGRSGTWQYLSVLSLQYPKKPQELADDLESIVYILTRMAIRFHRHTKSPIYPDDPTPDEIREVNATNGRLTNFVSLFFDEQEPCEDGYWSGGDQKRQALQGNTLPVLLTTDDDEETPLAKLLDALYTLLRRHYSALDYEELERFKVDPKKVKLRTSNTTTKGRNKAANDRGKLVAKPSTLDTEDPLERLRPRRIQALPVIPESEVRQLDEASTSEPGQNAAPLKKRHIQILLPVEGARRVLDTHEEILKAFEGVLYKPGRIRRDLSKYSEDKWYDQLDGLKSNNPKSDQKPSGSGALKRKIEEEKFDEEFDFAHAEALKKRVRGETFRAW